MSQPAPPLVDDTWLGRLAVDPRRPLLPVLRHADAMVSWVVILAFLPTLYAVANRTLTEAGARQGLIALECMAAHNLNEFIDPVVSGAPASLGYQPLLMSWFTAFSLWLFGVGHSAGHVASAYLCTAGLIVSTYLLARRLGGERLGLLSALLLAFNPYVLKLAQEPVSQSAAAMFALLSMAGTVAHWQKATTQASIRLLFGGISLGLCLLAGGPVAIVVVAILVTHAAWWRFGAWQRPPSSSPFELAPRGRRTAIRSVLILSATGFAVGGWRCLLMGSRYGAEFWLAWMGIDSSGDGLTQKADMGWLSLLVSANASVLPLAVLSLVGVGALIREQIHPDEDFVRRHRGLLLVWLAFSTALWIWRGDSTSEAGTVSEFWRIMLIVPLTVSSAVGLVAIIDREIPFVTVLFIGGATLLDLAVCGVAGGTSLRLEGLADYGAVGGILIIAALIIPIVAPLFLGPAGTHEARQRRVLTGIVLGIISVNSVWGGLAVRRASYGDRELDDLRNGLSRLTSVSRWTLVTPAGNGIPPTVPPAQLLYTLRSVWPESEMLRVDSWTAVVTQVNGASSEAPRIPGTQLVVIFSPQGQARPAVPAGLLRAAAPPFVYRGHEIAAYYPGEPPT